MSTAVCSSCGDTLTRYEAEELAAEVGEPLCSACVRSSDRRQRDPAPVELSGGVWLERASDLLAEPDPGRTPFLIESLWVEAAIAAATGRWKTTKSYGLIDASISIVTGLPFLGRYGIPTPGPIVLVLEESGRAALWRRLDSLCRGRAIDRDALADLHFAANRRVRLDDAGWQQEILEVGKALGPRAFIFDPLARLKSPGRDENAQKEYAVLVEFLRDLRDETGAAVAFVQHTGHAGEHMRGTSDLETVWESRLRFERDDAGTVTLKAEHREAEESEQVSYRLDWDEPTRTIRLRVQLTPTEQRVADHLAEHPEASANEVAKALGGNRQDVLAAVKKLRPEVVPDSGNHPGTTPLGTPYASGSPDPPLPFRGEGSENHRASAGSENLEPLPTEQEISRVLADLPEWREAPPKLLIRHVLELRQRGYFEESPA